MNNEIIVKTIKSLCKDKNMTTGQLEKEIGLSQGLVSKWLKTTPSLDKIIDIADYFGVSVDKVLGRETNKMPFKKKNEFIDNLFKLTKKNQLEWQKGEQLDENICSQLWLHDYENNEIFFINYNQGKLILQMGYDIENGKIDVYTAQFYILAESQSSLVIEDCDEEQLYELWLYLHSKFYGFLDEVKAENYKNEVMSNINMMVVQNLSQTISDMPDNTNVVDNFLKNENIKKALVTTDIPEIQQISAMLTNTNMIKTVDMIQKLIKYFNDIDKEKKHDGDEE